VPIFRSRGGAESVERRATTFGEALRQEPAGTDVDWLAAVATKGDADHAVWELRYARRALGVLVAQRDALDDRTASAVARAVTEGFSSDPAVDPRMVDVAVGQFNARLSAYRDILQARGGAPVAVRLGQMLLAFAGGPIGRGQTEVGRAGEILAGYLADSAAELQRIFGAASLPEDLPPSALAR
jgi:hypothetical protein